MEGSPATFGSAYRLLSGAVVPRPIAWVGSRSATGVDNLAPFSFFNVVTFDPPVLMFAPVGTGEDRKDTARNVLAREEFIVHVVTRDLAEAMNATSATLDADESEFDHAGLTAVDATAVDAPRVAEANVAFECRLYDATEVGASTMVLGEVVHVHVDEELLTAEGKIDGHEIDAIGRLAGSHYTTTRDRFAMERPP